MTENHVTRDEFNGYTQRTDSLLRTICEKQASHETKLASMPKLVAAEISKGNVKTWIAPTLTAVAAILLSKYM